MATSDGDEMFADAEIDGVGRRLAFGGFLRGLLTGLLLAAVGLVAWSVVLPPKNLRGGSAVEVVGAPAPASDGEVAVGAASGAGPEAETPEVAAAPEQPAPAAQVGAPEQPAPTAQESGPVQDSSPEAGTSAETPAVESAVPEVEPEPEGGTEAETAAVAPTEKPVVTPSPAIPETAETPEAPVASEEPATPDAPAVTEAPATPAPLAPRIALAGPAIEVNARPYQAPAEAPLLAVVLTGAGPDTVKTEGLTFMTMPLTLAIPPADGAGAFGNAARGAGHEVLAELASVAEGADPGTAAAETLEALAELDMAIGASAPAGQPLPTDRRLIEAVMTELGTHGFAFVDLRAGIGTQARTAADAEGVPFADGGRYAAPGASEDQIYQMINGAAFQARRDGTAIVAVAASPDALKAILRWGLIHGGEQVRFAPLSAVIARQSGG